MAPDAGLTPNPFSPETSRRRRTRRANLQPAAAPSCAAAPPPSPPPQPSSISPLQLLSLPSPQISGAPGWMVGSLSLQSPEQLSTPSLSLSTQGGGLLAGDLPQLQAASRPAATPSRTR